MGKSKRPIWKRWLHAGFLSGDLLKTARMLPKSKFQAFGFAWGFWGIAIVKMEPSYLKPRTAKRCGGKNEKDKG